MTILNAEQNLIRVENTVISYPHLWQKFGQQNPSYGVQCILDPGQKAEHNRAMQEIMQLTGKILQQHDIDPQFAQQMMPLKQGDQRNMEAQQQGRTPRPEIAGKWVINASDKNYAPAVYDQNQMLMTEAQSANIFGGCICNVVFNLYWYNAPQNRGVGAGLKLVQLISNVGVERFGEGGGITEEQARAYLVSVPGAPASTPAQPTEIPFGGPAPLTPAPTNAGPMPWE